jgi:hypothetical protein
MCADQNRARREPTRSPRRRQPTLCHPVPPARQRARRASRRPSPHDRSGCVSHSTSRPATPRTMVPCNRAWPLRAHLTSRAGRGAWQPSCDSGSAPLRRHPRSRPDWMPQTQVRVLSCRSDAGGNVGQRPVRTARADRGAPSAARWGPRSTHREPAAGRSLLARAAAAPRGSIELLTDRVEELRHVAED